MKKGIRNTDISISILLDCDFIENVIYLSKSKVNNRQAINFQDIVLLFFHNNLAFSLHNSLNRYFEKLGETINSFVPCVQV